MKRTIFTCLILCTIISLLAFTWHHEPEIYFDNLLDEKSKSEILFTTDSDALTTNLSKFLAPKMNQVIRVDAHWGAEKEYYFSVYGQKDGEAVVQQVLVSEEMVCNQSFPTVEALGLESESMIVYCYWETIDIGPFTISVCKVIDEGVVCGVSPSGGLCVRVRDLPIEQL